MRLANCVLALASGFAFACASLGPPKEPLVPTPKDALPIVPPAPDAASGPEFPVVHTTKLDSGLTVIRAPRSESQTVGIALVSRAPHPVQAGAFEARSVVQRLLLWQSPLAAYGYSGESDPQGTVLQTEVLAPDAEGAMRGLADVFRSTRWPADMVTDALQVEATRRHMDAWTPGLVARQQAIARLFSGDEALGDEDDAGRLYLQGLSPDDVSRLARSLYATSHSALCVVGDEVTTEAALALAATLPLATKAPDLLGAMLQPTPVANAVYVVDMPSPQAYIAAAFVAPRASEADFPAMWLLDRLAGRMFTSALNLDLREERALSYNPRTSMVTSIAFGAWLFEAAVDGDRVSDAISALHAQFQRMTTDISADEFDRAKAMAVAELEARLETNGGLLSWLAWRFQQGLETTDVASFLQQVRGLALSTVQEFARYHIPEHLGPVVVVGPGQYIRAQLQWTDYRVRD